jgi:hypothetical protein
VRNLAYDAVGTVAGAAFAAAAALRRAKAVHPHGVVHAATLSVPGAATGAELFDVPAERRALVRFSRSLGLPRPLPDLLGLSLRVLDAYGAGAHQDLLMVTGGEHPLLHHLFLPADDVQQRPYTSNLPYRVGGELLVVGALPAGDGRFHLAVAPIGARFERVGTIAVGARLEDTLDELPFNPFNTGGGLEPAGFLNRLRAYAYPASQAARPRTAPAARRAARLTSAGRR